MSNFECPRCGALWIDLGKDGYTYTTEKEIQLSRKAEQLEQALKTARDDIYRLGELFKLANDNATSLIAETALEKIDSILRNGDILPD